MKARRHMKIRQLIAEKPIETQEELAELLEHEGFKVTQATVSRDIKELRLIKVLTDGGKYCYALPDRPPFSTNHLLRVFKESVSEINSSGNLIVIKTLSGTASAVAEAIDGLGWKDILGTIAGDNTILVVASSPGAVKGLLERFDKIMS